MAEDKIDKSQKKTNDLQAPASPAPSFDFDPDALMRELAPRIREFKNSISLFRENITALLGLSFVIFIILLAVFAPMISPPTSADPMYIPRDFKAPKPPGADGHILGTGNWGTDMLYGIVWGARTSISISLFVVLTGVLIGLVVGSIAGFYGGKIDNLMMRITDIFLSLPALILAMAIASILERNLENMMLAIVIVWWPSYARLIRAQVLSIKENTYVEAARAIGVKKNRILFKHIIPNSISPLIVAATMDIGSVVLVAAGLSYIGFGVSTGSAEWGRMVSDGQAWFLSTVYWEGREYTASWVVLFPGLAILIFTMGFSLLGDALRDILDPRMRR
ncbi:MAG: ABC transporter permease [Euryarchaeota archaeon]|nr:ABC transporter permease [Euryarchaeota archaeon]